MKYLVRINDEEQGPYSYEDLEMFERIGEINPVTKVRRESHDVWRDWGIVRSICAEEKQRAARYAPPLAVGNRPEPSKHSALKIVVGFWIGCAVLGAVGSLLWIALGAVLTGAISFVGSAITATVCYLIFRALDEK